MLRSVLILLALLFSAPVHAQPKSVPCHTSNGANCIPEFAASNSVAISVAAATTTELVALIAGKNIYITSWDVMASNTNNVKLVYGTGSACGTGTTNLTGSYPLIAQAGISKGNGTGAILFVPSGNALCITTSGSSQTSGSASYAQY